MDVRVKSIEIKNFKCYADKTFDFDEQNAVISGQNGIGKSTIIDAYVWCLTGKLPNSKSDGASIRPLGQPVEVIPEVVVTLAVIDGDYTHGTTVFSRKLEATYTGRGIDKTYKGDATVLSIDGVPKNVSEFNAYVAQLFPINASVWTDITTFADDTKFSADDRRKVLVEAFGNISDDSIKALNPLFDELFTAKGKLSVEDFKIAQKEQEKSCNAELGRGKTQGTLQARIDEATKSIVNPMLSVAEQEQKIADLEAQIKTASSGADDDVKARLAAKRQELIDYDVEISRDRAAKHNKKYADNDAKQIAVSHDMSAVKEKIAQMQKDISNAESEIRMCEAQICSCERNKKRLEEEQPNIETVCPTCGQPLPQDRIDEAIGNYNEHKAASLEAYEKQINDSKDRIAKQTEIINEAKVSIENGRKKLAELDNEVGDLARERQTLMEQPIEDNNELIAKRAAVKDEIDALTIQVQLAGTGELVADLTAMLRVEQSKLAEAQANDRQRKRITELVARQKEVAAMLSEAQRMIALCDQFITTKASYIEQSISSHFEGVTFKLFDVFKNGEIKNACVPIMDGKPFSLLSFSQRTVASVAILNGLSKHYGFTAPLFIDNASEMDSTTTAKLATEGQHIVVKVSDDDFKLEFSSCGA